MTYVDGYQRRYRRPAPAVRQVFALHAQSFLAERLPSGLAEARVWRRAAPAPRRRRSWRSESTCSRIELGTTKQGLVHPDKRRRRCSAHSG